MAAAVSMPLGVVRMMKKLPSLPLVPQVVSTVDGILPKFFPRLSDIVP